jgi:hypothetical protein
MNLMRSMRLALRACASGALLIACWAAWLVLIAALGLQIWVLTRRQLELPAFAVRAIERRLATPEITPRFGQAVFDPTGRLLLRQVELFGRDGSTPLVTIRAAYARLEFLPMLIGEIRVHEVRLTGVDLRVPAMLSPSGTDESVVSDLDGVFQIQQSDCRIGICTFHVGGVAIASHGGFHIPSKSPSQPGTMPLLDLVLERYLKTGRKLVALRPQIEALKEPRLQLTLTPDSDAGAIVEARLLVDSSAPNAPCNVQSAQAHTVFPLLGNSPVATEVTIDAQRVAWKEQVRATRLHVTLTGLLVPDGFVFTPQTARLAAGKANAMGLSFTAPAVELALEKWPRVQGDAILQAGGAPLLARADIETRLGDGRIDLTASLTSELLRLAATRFGLGAVKWVTLSEPASLQARLELTEGWKPARVEGEISVRHAIANGVSIDAAGGHIVYGGHGLDVTDLTLFQGDNAAYGSYAMDTNTQQYRFLLRGHLRPLDISGWFQDWWPRFWRGFDFAAAPPVADVDVAGRWGTAQESVVFCQAEASQPGIRGVPFDQARTTLFFRPDYFEVSRFKVERGGHAGLGSFTVAVDSDNSTYRTLDFDAVSDLDISECARLYGPAGVALAAPFRFTEPPLLHFTGHLDGPAVPGGPHEQIRCAVVANNRLTIHDFPLDAMKFSADYRDSDLNLQNVELGFAGGTTTGWARIAGPPKARTIALEARVQGANLGRVISIFNELQSARKPDADEQSADQLLRRASTGHLEGRVAASGLQGEPFSYHGDGQVTVTGQELGEIHLLGLLSEMLSKNRLLNFTSLRLDKAQANFRIEGNKLAFPQVKLQGPRTAIDAKGDYLLESKTLDFTARIYPLQESKVAVADALGALLTPLSNVLELKLTGPVGKPFWSFVFGPTNLLRTITRPLNIGPSAPDGTPSSVVPPLAPTEKLP